MERLRKLRNQVERAAPHRRADDIRKHRGLGDIPDPKEHPWRYRYLKARWRVALAIVTHPVLLALTVALLVVAVPIWQLVGVSSGLRRTQKTQGDQQAQITSLVKRIQIERANTVGVFCASINKNIRSNRQLTVYLRKLLITGAKQSAAFEDLYRQHGFPPYLVRLKQAQGQADKIVSFSGPLLKCADIRARIEQTTPPPPGPPVPPH
jgi:hypothetical protein